MNEFIQFLKDNLVVLLTSLSALIGLISIIVKRKPKTLDEFLSIVNDVINTVPSLVCYAESEIGSGKGDQKKALVISCALKQIKNQLKRNLSESEIALVRSRVCDALETVLEAPEKKEK